MKCLLSPHAFPGSGYIWPIAQLNLCTVQVWIAWCESGGGRTELCANAAGEVRGVHRRRWVLPAFGLPLLVFPMVSVVAVYNPSLVVLGVLLLVFGLLVGWLVFCCVL